MYAANAERQHAGEPAKVKGPAYKQASEEVDTISQIFHLWDSEERKAAAKQDDAIALAAKDELLPALARTAQLQPRIQSMSDKANEPDPDLQTYGPVMKGKVLALAETYKAMVAKGEELQAAYDEAVASALLRSQSRAKQRDDEQAAARRRAEEAAAAAEAAEEAAKKAAQEAARAAREQEQEAARRREEALNAKVEAAEERNRQAALAMAKGVGGVEIEEEETPNRWVTDPIGEGSEELTLEMALAMEAQSQRRLASLRDACAVVLAQNSPQAAHTAAHSLIIYLRNILREPRTRDVRRIPADNAHFLSTVGGVTGGKETMLALGFEEEEEAAAGEGPRRSFFVLNRVYLDDLRAAMKLLEGGARR